MADPATVRTVSLVALQRARTTLEDFTFSYFPYLGLSPLADFFKYMDVLVWLEATVYELDEQNERMSKHGMRAPSLRLAGEVLELASSGCLPWVACLGRRARAS